MATVLETLAVPRSSPAMASPTFSPISASSVSSFSGRRTSSVSSFSGRRTSVSVPKFRGLRISTSVSTGSVCYNPRLARRGARIVCEAQDTAVAVPAVTDANWQSVVLESDLPVLVEFWAPWCGPCRMIHPIIDELSKEYIGKFKFFKVNTDESPSIATQYGIRSIPTVIIFKSGEKKDAVIGAVPKSTLTTSIEKFL